VTEPQDSITTDRLSLLPLTPEDADEMIGVLDDERLHTFIGGEPLTIEALRDRYRVLARGQSSDGLEKRRNWIVRLLSDGQAIGTVQATIVLRGREASIAWLIGVPWQGQGFASEAAVALVAWLEARGVDSITANIHPDHLASAGVAIRAGLGPTDEVRDGERVWRRPQPKRNPDSSTWTDESG
jgi:RimJ/RimL family protein N-acetyltransferase